MYVEITLKSGEPVANIDNHLAFSEIIRSSSAVLETINIENYAVYLKQGGGIRQLLCVLYKSVTHLYF